LATNSAAENISGYWRIYWRNIASQPRRTLPLGEASGA
jgi:hypothetical protein